MEKMIRIGQRVFLEYSVFLEDGTEVDSNVGEAPLSLIVGEHQIFPLLEEALLGRSIGETIQLTLDADDAYGPIVPEAFREVDLDYLPKNFRYEGAILGVQDPEGGVFPIRVHQLRSETAILDFNHPLAGKALQFQIRIADAVF